MADPIKHIYITAAEGREVPFPSQEASAPGGDLLRVLAGKTYRVPYSTFTRRRIASGDIVMVDGPSGKPTKDLAKAHAVDAHDHDETGAIAGGEVTTQGHVEPKFDLSDREHGHTSRKG